MSRQKKEETPPGFEESLAQLEVLVRQLEDGDLKLEEALTAFEEGIRLSRHCQQVLQSAEQRVNKLVSDEGTLKEVPFTPEDTVD